MIKSEQCLAALITYFGEDRDIYQESLDEISEYLSKHKKSGRINIVLNNSHLMSHLSGLCEKVIAITMATDNNYAYE